MTMTEPDEKQAAASLAVTPRDAMAYRRSMGLVALAATLFAFYLGLLPFLFVGADLAEVVARLVVSARNLSPGDKSGGLVGHATALAIIAFLLTGALSYRRSAGLALLAAIVALAVVSGIGILIEIAQGFTRFRTVSAGDAAAGILGGGIGTLAWLVAGERIVGVAHGLKGGSLKPLHSALTLYVVAYLLLGFFPYDFTLSPANWVERFSATRFLGAEGASHVFNLLASFLGALPLGIFLGLHVAARGRRLLLAVLIGFGIELLQGFQATGHVVLMAGVARAAGMALGAHWADTRIALDRLRRPDARLVLGGTILVYLLLLTVASGWYRDDMPAWEGIRWSLAHTSYLPFFYHALEADLPAVVSLIFVAAAYGVAGLLWRLLDYAWLRGTRGLTVALVGGLLAAGMEIGGLVFGGQRMDSSSVVIALFVMPAAYRITGRILAALEGTPAVPDHEAGKLAVPGQPDRQPSATSVTQGRPLALAGQPRWKLAIAGVAAIAVLLFVMDFPIANPGLAVLFAAYAALLWRYPDSWLVVLPAAIPVFDLTPWSGRFFLTEFDILIVITLAIALLRTRRAGPAFRLGTAARWWIFLMTASYGVSLLVGILPLSPLDANAFSSYYSDFNALRVAKGYFAALLLLPFLLRALRNNPRAVLLLSGGMVLGLALNGLVILRERHLLTGLLNFSNDYRATGLFSSMHIGGAYLDAYLLATIPFLAILMFLRRRMLGLVGLVLLFGLAFYSIVATASRAPLAALAVTFIILAGGLFLATRHRVSAWVRWGVICFFALMVAFSVALPLIPGDTFVRQRFATTETDSLVRVDHWENTLLMRDDGILTTLVGMGLGSYPRTYLLNNRDGIRLATYSVQTGAEGNPHLVLGSGRSLYVSQDVPLQPHTDYVISARLQAEGGRPKMTFPVCEKWLISSWQCQWKSVELQPGGGWQTITIPFNSESVGASHGRMGTLSRRPVKFSLYNPGPQTLIRIDDIELKDASGRSILQNGDFSNGMDHWFFTVDDHLPWHAKNILIHILFEQGILGLAAFVGLGAAAVLGLMRTVATGDRFSAILLSSIIGMGVIGGIDSIINDPRLALLWYLLLFTALGIRAMTRDDEEAKNLPRTPPSST